MHVNGKSYTAVWMEGSSVMMIEQNLLPFQFQIYEARTHQDVCHAIKTMITRGAGCIGVAAGFGMAQAFMEAPKNNFSSYIEKAKADIEATRPTARDLFAATHRVFEAGKISVQQALNESNAILSEYVEAGRKIGEFGAKLIQSGYRIETHCNAGWLGLVEWGSALSPIYTAQNQGKEVFVWVDETRPRSQGARLTAWELHNEKVPHKIVPDNAGAYLMSHGMVDMMIVGADRIAANGDAANKIGTLEKAIVAQKYHIPFYVAAPRSTFDHNCATGNDIPIEERTENEVLFQTGIDKHQQMHEILVCSPESTAFNPAFDVTPHELITGIITEDGILSYR
ncbi:MAG: S-methyl-5-thioribose-1-phosphate isomerase [Bacteroidales bacterium]|nr:S-methyl-5-thioribose-1-phosphate isomerase [Bacteroidales bacterium]